MTIKEATKSFHSELMASKQFTLQYDGEGPVQGVGRTNDSIILYLTQEADLTKVAPMLVDGRYHGYPVNAVVIGVVTAGVAAL